MYQGKELQEELGLGTFDFEARMYDPSTGRTFQLDPHADSYFDLSPYSWVANNPINIIDPTGMDTVSVNNLDMENLDTEEDVVMLDEVSVSPEPEQVQGAMLKDESTGKPINTSLTKSYEEAESQAGYEIAVVSLVTYELFKSQFEHQNSGGDGSYDLARAPIPGAVNISKIVERLRKIKNAQLALKLNKGNSVTIKTPKGQIRYDLAGRPHGGVPTPHKQLYQKNFHNGQLKSITRSSKKAVEMTDQEIRLVRKYLESIQ